MSRDDWSGVKLFMNGDASGEWLHFVSQTSLEALDMHDEAVELVEGYRLAYMNDYGDNGFHLVNPETKYDSSGEFL